jgi:hypothetical protein
LLSSNVTGMSRAGASDDRLGRHPMNLDTHVSLV